MHAKLLKLPLNTQGRDFVVGDIHFKITELFQGLEALGFDKATDRVIGVGDLIDRGVDVIEGLTLLGQPWFHAVQGNHEHMLIRAWLEHPQVPYSAHGARWWLNIADESRGMIIGKLQSLPLVIEIESAHGITGVLHADIPAGLGWQTLIEHLDDPRIEQSVLWGRERILKQQSAGVDGVWRVCVGHTRLPCPQRLGNVMALDCTGGGEGPLGIYCVQEDALYVNGRCVDKAVQRSL